MTVVIGNHTVMDGFVIRWYASEASATHGTEVISASRNGVMGGAGANLTPELFEAAWAAHKKLEAGSRYKSDFTDIITHEREISGDVTPVAAVSGNEEVQS